MGPSPQAAGLHRPTALSGPGRVLGTGAPSFFCRKETDVNGETETVAEATGAEVGRGGPVNLGRESLPEGVTPSRRPGWWSDGFASAAARAGRGSAARHAEVPVEVWNGEQGARRYAGARPARYAGRSLLLPRHRLLPAGAADRLLPAFVLSVPVSVYRVFPAVR